jgi:DNA-directed RNA polymerase specialized sigma24 family protein
MDENQRLAERFEEHRVHLRSVAYRMLGSLTEADDAVQDAWLRLSRSRASEVENLGGWLTTVVARVCLNILRSRTVRREESFGVHLPDPDLARQRVVVDAFFQAARGASSTLSSPCSTPRSCYEPTLAPGAPEPPG